MDRTKQAKAAAEYQRMIKAAIVIQCAYRSYLRNRQEKQILKEKKVEIDRIRHNIFNVLEKYAKTRSA